MPSAEIVTIGTELLLGEIVDTNSAYLARKLRDLNIDIFRTSTVGDNPQRIAEILQETMARADIIITTGGLGPTVDDPTREAVALALGVGTEFRAELWQQIIDRLARFGRTPTENQKKQAYVPIGAIGIQNPVGTAPAFIALKGSKCIISLPGVPREMEYLTENEVLPYLRKTYQLKGLIKARVLHTAGIGESIVDEKIEALEKLGNPTVGLAAHHGRVDIRITAKADAEDQADNLIAGVEQQIRSLLAKDIYGVDGETLAGSVLPMLTRNNWPLVSLEAGTNGTLSQTLAGEKQDAIFLGGKIITQLPDLDDLAIMLQAEQDSLQAKCGMALSLRTVEKQTDVDVVIITPAFRVKKHLSYGGHPKSGPAWAVTSALDIFRRKLAHLID